MNDPTRPDPLTHTELELARLLPPLTRPLAPVGPALDWVLVDPTVQLLRDDE
jgi:hypothetical protein